MRINGKCNNSQDPSHRLKGYSAFRQNPVFPKDQNMKNCQHYIDVRGEVLPTPRGTRTAKTAKSNKDWRRSVFSITDHL